VVRGYKAQHEVLNNKLNASDSAILELIWADGVVVLGLEHPYSRGSVKAASSSIFDAPHADSALLANPLDVAILTEGVKFIRVLMKTKAISELHPFELVPGVNVTRDADIADFIRQTSATLYHPAGSCKMGARETGGVVDGELKVYGISGLRVVDASVMPLLPASHIMTTVYGVAEKVTLYQVHA
jgi:choline dehydrogenase-like flavoprotein